MSHKIVKKTTVLQDILEDSNRLSPFIFTLFDDLRTNVNVWKFVSHVLNVYCDNLKNPKHTTVLCLENSDKEKFYIKHKIRLNPKITLLTEDDIGLSLDNSTNDLFNNDDITSKLVSYNQLNQDNVLVIDSVIPVIMSNGGMDNGIDNVSIETSSKRLCQWINGLSNQGKFSHIITICHTDCCDRYLELSLANISNAIVDFRLESNGGDKKLAQCPFWKHKSTENSIHTFVTAKKKHPRTHWKLAREHEHFTIDEKDSSIKFLTKEMLNKTASAQLDLENVGGDPESTFNLKLKKEEQEAKDSLILPYIKKNTNAIQNNKKPESAGKVIYEYDQFDDFDDEDPDDDLDF